MENSNQNDKNNNINKEEQRKKNNNEENNKSFSDSIQEYSNEKISEEVTSNDNAKDKIYNFLINALNQANVVNTSNSSFSQINSLIILIDPYQIEKINFGKNIILTLKLTTIKS
ncbi:hypothetical protein [Halothermothrix orenii]|uniref:hypothetical protein n=1 Tax=Halothermothrix orenii TaxID=31909 RepID=UPI0002F44B03|nr:hypothetical protein [Halothermothrix orenii]